MYIVFFILLMWMAPTLACRELGLRNGEGSRVLLEKVSAITLEQGKLTTARRVSAIPQLRCVGGSAGCNGWQPKVVQCLNRGSDGYDVQWECKTEMDEEYQFGRIQVLCEGYDSPSDPYILSGSCGLEYELDWSPQRADSNQHHHQPYYQYSRQLRISLTDVILIAACCLGTYWLLKCVCNPHQASNTTRSEYHSSATITVGTGSGGGGGGGGFWTGAGVGGALGYLFGSRFSQGSGWNNPTYGSWGSGWSNPTYGSWGSGWSRPTYGSSHSGFRWSTSRTSSSGSRSRTTSGFGGTSRR